MMSSPTTKSSPSAKAPVSLTGGRGFRFENEVAARLLLDMLGATNVLGDKFGTIARLDWQARESGWLADDLVASCETSAGPRVAALSLKSGQSVTNNGFPNEFVEIAWQQWKQNDTEREFQKSNDVIILATGDGNPYLILARTRTTGSNGSLPNYSRAGIARDKTSLHFLAVGGKSSNTRWLILNLIPKLLTTTVLTTW